ncbi:MAG: hypothetical protein AAFO94_00740, partial [Bacteroidota bacterium]
MKLSITPTQLRLKETFTIARDSYSAKDIVIVALEDGTHTGYGEACEHVYYEVSVPHMIGEIEKVRSIVESFRLGEENDGTPADLHPAARAGRERGDSRAHSQRPGLHNG